jgi:2-methylcitrate synthase
MDVKTTQGLAGVTVGDSAIATVGQAGMGLCYRGYRIEDLAAQSTFEEVAYLLIYDELPTKIQLAKYQQQLVQNREIPESLKRILQQVPAIQARIINWT